MPHPAPRALVTLPDVAVPADSGRRLRSLNTVTALARHYRLDVVLVVDGRPEVEPLPPLEGTRWEVLQTRARTGPAAAVASLRHGLPWTVAHQDWDATATALRRWTGGTRYDLAWFGALAHALALAPHVASVRSTVDVDDVESAKWLQYLRQRPTSAGQALDHLQRAVEYPMWKGLERRVTRLVDVALLSAPDDVPLLARSGITNTHVFPNTFPDPGPLERSVDRAAPVLAFVGNFAHGPNRDAARALAGQVLPAVREHLPAARVRLVGRNPGAVQDLAGLPGVDLVGAVDEVRDHLRDVLATVVPITYGGGTRLKVLEAFALGVPVVSTEVGVAGLGAVAGESYLRAEDPRQFAAAAVRLAQDPGTGAALEAAGRRRYEEAFTSLASRASVDALVAGWA